MRRRTPVGRIKLAAEWILSVPARLWESITPDNARKIRDVAFAITALFALYAVFQMLDLQRDSRTRGLENRQVIREIDENTNAINDVVDQIESQTSPEVQARQQQIIDDIIQKVDCNNREALQDTIDVLVERGVLESGDVRVALEDC